MNEGKDVSWFNRINDSLDKSIWIRPYAPFTFMANSLLFNSL